MNIRFPFLSAFCAVALLSAACASEEGRFRRDYNMDGTASEQWSAPPPAKPDEVRESNLSRYCRIHPQRTREYIGPRLGYFYFKKGRDAGYGTGTADVLDQVAFFALQLPAARQKELAPRIHELFSQDDCKGADELLQSLKKELRVEEDVTCFPEDSRQIRERVQYRWSQSGEKIPFGLRRELHDNGMIRREEYALPKKDSAASEPALPVREYNRDGSLVSADAPANKTK